VRINTAPAVPEETRLEFASLDRIEDADLRRAAAYWRDLRGPRRFPPREALNPSRIPSLLRHLGLVRVIDGGKDFEYRIVGDSVARAFRVCLHNRLLSEVAAEAPSTAAEIARIYGHAVESGEGFVLRGVTGYQARSTNFRNLEALILPMGANDSTVDHLLTFMVC
jgi:hypothetical protein